MTVHDPETRTLELSADEFPELREASDGLQGAGRFRFRVVQRGELAGRVTIEVSDIVLEVENRADKSLKKLMARNQGPGEADEPDEDDGTDVV